MNHRFNKIGFERDFPEQRNVVFCQELFCFLCSFFVDIEFIDDCKNGKFKRLHQFIHALRIMQPRNRGFNHHQNKVGSGERCNNRTADSGRAVADDKSGILFNCNFFGFAADFGYQPARILFAGTHPRVYHGSKSCIGNKPAVIAIFHSCNGIDGTESFAQPATFALKRVDFRQPVLIRVNRTEPAVFFA